MMMVIQVIRSWFGKLVSRPADLFDLGSAFATVQFIGLASWNLAKGNLDAEIAPSMSYLTSTMPLWFWFLVVGITGLLQPVALHYDNPNDLRHPILQPTKWARSVLALICGIWFFILYLSMWMRLGPHHMEAMYALVVCMNAYIISHVLFRNQPVIKLGR